jgi:hypothetical protein
MDREKVIKGLECCTKKVCIYKDIEKECPYLELCGDYGDAFEDCTTALAKDALALLKAQEPRVMTWEEAQTNVQDGPFIIFEVRDSTGDEVDFGVLAGDYYEMSEGSALTVADFWMLKDDYGKRFRLSTSRPSDEQRQAVKWK